MVGLVGRSGSGKSTLLHLLAGLLTPRSGQVWVDGELVSSLNDNQRSAFRLRHVGMLFQDGDLVPELSLGENVALPLILQGVKKRDASARAETSLRTLDVETLSGRRPSDVSGGQRQRVALARALVHEPRVILADEPTGALDESSAADALTEIARAAQRHQIPAVIVTHDPVVAASCDRVLRLVDGTLGEVR